MKLAVDLTASEAWALAQMCKRFGVYHVKLLASPFDTYDGGTEAEVMLEGVLKLQRALNEAGYWPR